MSDVFDEFFKWIGISITEWAHVEEHLFLICRRCLRTRIDLTAIVYYRTPNLDSRLKLVNELVCANLPQQKQKNGGHDHPDLKQWIFIQKEIGSLLSTRRRIAHLPMRADIDYETSEGFRVRMEESLAEELRGRARDEPGPLKQEGLEHHVIKLQAVIQRLKAFYEETLPKHCG